MWLIKMQFSMHTTSNNQGVGTVLELPGIDTKLREVLKEAIASFMVRPQTKRFSSSSVSLAFQVLPHTLDFPMEGQEKLLLPQLKGLLRFFQVSRCDH